MNEMKSLTLNGKKYDSFLDQTARQQIKDLTNTVGQKLPMPPKAAVGQYFRVAAVDANGIVTAVEAVDAPSGGDASNIRDAVFAYMEQDATGAVVAVDAQEPTSEDNTTYVVMQSKNGTIFRMAIGNDGLPFVTNEAGAVVWTGASGGTGGGDGSGDTGGDDTGGGEDSTEIPSDVTGVYSNSTITEIPDNTFKGNKKITGIIAPNVTKVGFCAFYSCGGLEEVSLPKAKTLSQYAFVWCSALTKIVLPSITTAGIQSFGFCTRLAIADFGGVPSADGLRNQVFTGDSALSTLILRCDSTVWPSHHDALSGTAIASGNGHIYVPAKLLDQYKATAPWNNYAEQFRALEDYTVDGTITGELDTTKIGGNAA
jgi:hypothetical protein